MRLVVAPVLPLYSVTIMKLSLVDDTRGTSSFLHMTVEVSPLRPVNSRDIVRLNLSPGEEMEGGREGGREGGGEGGREGGSERGREGGKEGRWEGGRKEEGGSEGGREGGKEGREG